MASGNNSMNEIKTKGNLPVNGSGNAVEETPERAGWGRPLEFILACLGYAVGLGNVWRFPYLCYRNGGGAFLIPFFLMLVFIGLPLFYLELYIGQFTALGPLKAFSSISPFFSGVGYCTLVVICIISIYFMIIIAWTSFYTFVSIGGDLGWGSCENDYNTDFCYSGAYDKECRVNNTGDASDLTYYLRRCMRIDHICQMTGFQPYDGKYCLNDNETVPWYTNVNRRLASEEYYNERVLGRGDATWENWGTIQWHLVGCLFFSWVVAFLVVIKIFYSFGVGCGSLVTLASYNNFYNNCHFDAVIVSITNFLTSIYAGFVIFSVLGFQAQLMGVTIDRVAAEGPGLAFVVYPEALLQMPIPQLWCILFFFMLFILGLGSQFAGIEAINTAIVDQWPQLRKRYWMVTAGTCFSCFLLGLPMCFSGGVYMFTLLDWNTASWAILLIGIAETTAVAWSYGINRAMRDLASMNMKLNVVLRWYWKLAWTLIVPIFSIAILVFIFSNWTAPYYEDYVFPLFADLIGWAVGLSTLIFFPVGLCWALCKGYRGKELFTPTPRWKAAVKTESLNSDVSLVNNTASEGNDNLAYVL